ncbi:MAG: hypothetical protein LBL82_05600 [Oscillospiraceae bacterium]|nr:hypothetical protein [Oscillospiraceae bacterium]
MSITKSLDEQLNNEKSNPAQSSISVVRRKKSDAAFAMPPEKPTLIKRSRTKIKDKAASSNTKIKAESINAEEKKIAPPAETEAVTNSDVFDSDFYEYEDEYEQAGLPHYEAKPAPLFVLVWRYICSLFLFTKNAVYTWADKYESRFASPDSHSGELSDAPLRERAAHASGVGGSAHHAVKETRKTDNIGLIVSGIKKMLSTKTK